MQAALQTLFGVPSAQVLGELIASYCFEDDDCIVMKDHGKGRRNSRKAAELLGERRIAIMQDLAKQELRLPKKVTEEFKESVISYATEQNKNESATNHDTVKKLVDALLPNCKSVLEVLNMWKDNLSP